MSACLVGVQTVDWLESKDLNVQVVQLFASRGCVMRNSPPRYKALPPLGAVAVRDVKYNPESRVQKMLVGRALTMSSVFKKGEHKSKPNGCLAVSYP
jgi:hypothetical protein